MSLKHLVFCHVSPPTTPNSHVACDCRLSTTKLGTIATLPELRSALASVFSATTGSLALVIPRLSTHSLSDIAKCLATNELMEDLSRELQQVMTDLVFTTSDATGWMQILKQEDISWTEVDLAHLLVCLPCELVAELLRALRPEVSFAHCSNSHVCLYAPCCFQ